MTERKNHLNLADPNNKPLSIIWALAWPTILEQILQVTVTYVDSAMVGSLGARATASVSVVTPTIWLVNGWMNAFSIGFGVLMARNLGAGRKALAQETSRQALGLSIGFALALSIGIASISKALPVWIGAEPLVQELAQQYLFFIAVGYLPNMVMILISTLLRCSGDSRTPLYLNGLNNILNIILNLFFIFPSIELGVISLKGLGLGVKGAAIATSAACTITAINLFIALFFRDNPISPSLRLPWRLEWSICRQAFKLGLPVALERSTLSFGQIVLTKMVGTLGTTALAAHYLSNTAESITFLPPSGFSTAATTLVAHALGSGNKTLTRKYASTTTIMGTLLMSLMGVVLYLLAPNLIAFFTSEREVIALGSRVLRIEALAEPAFGLSMLVFGVLRGAGDTRGPFYISLAGMWLLRLPFAYLLLQVTNLGLMAIWIAMASDMTLRGIICFVVYRRFKWLDSWKESH